MLPLLAADLYEGYEGDHGKENGNYHIIGGMYDNSGHRISVYSPP